MLNKGAPRRVCGGQKQLILSLRASWLRACSRNRRRKNCYANDSHFDHTSLQFVEAETGNAALLRSGEDALEPLRLHVDVLGIGMDAV